MVEAYDMPVSVSGKCVLRKTPGLAPPASTVWLLQASTMVLQRSFHVQYLSEASGRTVQLSCNGRLLWSPVHLCLPPLFGTDILAASQPPQHSAGHLKSVCGSLESLRLGLGTW